jgi:hypothetical protein
MNSDTEDEYLEEFINYLNRETPPDIIFMSNIVDIIRKLNNKVTPSRSSSIDKLVDINQGLENVYRYIYEVMLNLNLNVNFYGNPIHYAEGTPIHLIPTHVEKNADIIYNFLEASSMICANFNQGIDKTNKNYSNQLPLPDEISKEIIKYVGPYEFIKKYVEEIISTIEKINAIIKKGIYIKNGDDINYTITPETIGIDDIMHEITNPQDEVRLYSWEEQEHDMLKKYESEFNTGYIVFDNVLIQHIKTYFKALYHCMNMLNDKLEQTQLGGKSRRRKRSSRRRRSSSRRRRSSSRRRH